MNCFPPSRLIVMSLLALLMLNACGGGGKAKVDASSQDITKESDDELIDFHSYARPSQAVVTHMDMEIDVDFDQKIISGVVTYEIKNKKGVDKILFDTEGLEIEKVNIGGKEEATAFKLGEYDSIKGQELEVTIGPYTEWVHIYYSTKPGAKALQWLEPQQTADKKHPYLFTQSQSILARTWIPCQDGPGIRFTYSATVKVPKDLLAVMSASNPQKKNKTGVYYFEMNQPIPSYLMAMAVGDIAFKAIGERTGVYTEPSLLDKAAYEFGEMEKMLIAAEGLYGPYKWDRYDVIVLPPSFPFGGMENPRLTFATPTILAGDRSLTALIAHELAHSWSGNLVTNATWDDFWLNEGFTVYFEKRIMEALYGRDYVNMLAMLGYQDLEEDIKTIGPNSHDTHLKLNLDGRDPDDGMTDIAYEKGSLFLETVENIVGREQFDPFLRTYFEKNAFKTMTSEKFLAYMNKELIKGDKALEDKIMAEAWVFGPGLPENAHMSTSNRFVEVEKTIAAWEKGTTPAKDLGTDEWTTHEWLHFIRHLPESMNEKQMKDLDASFGFTQSGNSEILCAWFVHVINNEYAPSYPALEQFLVSVGRRKFLRPLYAAMAKTEAGKTMAKSIYEKARPNYHSVSTGTIDKILSWTEEAS